MDITVAHRQMSQRWRQSKRMSLLAAFEDANGGTRVKEFCQGLLRDLGSECRVIEHVWLFSTLRLRELQEIAAEEASASDLVIIAAHRAGGLPKEVEGWIELWLQQKARHSAVLLALLDPDYEGASTAIQNYLRQVAKRGKMEFLVLSKDEPEGH